MAYTILLATEINALRSKVKAELSRRQLGGKTFNWGKPSLGTDFTATAGDVVKANPHG